MYHPTTVDSCFVHDGHGLCGGIKDDKNNWNILPHKDRLVRITKYELLVLSSVFENNDNWECAKLTSLHDQKFILFFDKLSRFPKHLRDYESIISLSLNEAGAVQAGQIKRNTCFPNIDKLEMIYSGPLLYVCNPLYKTPRKGCKSNLDFDNIGLCEIPEEFIQRTNYTPIVDLESYSSINNSFDDSSKKWINYYKLAFRRMLSQTGERTLCGAIIPPATNHIDGVISCVFKDCGVLVEFTGLSSSLPLDFYLKVIGAANLHRERLESFPLGIADKYKSSLFARTLLLNCLTTAYADLWQEMWDGAYKLETWSLADKRLKPFNQLHENWAWDIPLRTFFERRMALVEIDVIAAMALGLTLEDLEMIYTIQFPVLQQNEADTWYDQKGNIVFTCSKGLIGVGLDRKRNARTGMLGWEDIRGDQIDENTYAGTSPTHTHTIDPAKSELYGGKQVTYYAPYTKCDRIADYRRAWDHFEKIFNK